MNRAGYSRSTPIRSRRRPQSCLGGEPRQRDQQDQNEVRMMIRYRIPNAMLSVLSVISLFMLPIPSQAFAASGHHHPPRKDPIPITVIAGFLGSGKTSLLMNMLQNDQNLRIAVVVNDVASVNIDSKLVIERGSTKTSFAAAGIVELQNGCACCSKSQELLASVAELVTLSDLRDDGGFDHIVIELSGVADPVGVRAKFQEAALYDMPLMERVQLDTLVTLIDCTTFQEHLRSAKTANEEESPELFYRVGESAPEEIDDESIPSELLDIFGMGSSPQEDSSGVAELVVSQTETADVLILNKIDLVSDATVGEINAIVSAFNPRSRVLKTTFGKVPLRDVLGVAKGQGVAIAGIVDDHKDAVHAVTCDDPSCTDPGHAHAAHSHQEESNYNDDTGHSHAHENGCDDPDCADASHSHSHSHSEPVSKDFGIGSFVYRARRPFHPARLAAFLRNLPVQRGISLERSTDDVSISPMGTAKQALQRVLRSKGFAWCADSHVSALYWSHAGTSFELSCLGSWWATLPREQWPSEAVKTILQDFDCEEHNEEAVPCSSVGDRRQEIVFIGPTLDDSRNQRDICRTLDQCLLTDEEWSIYTKNRSDDSKLQKYFASTLAAKIVTY